MKNHENQPVTMKNHENQPGTMKNHENRPVTMENQPGTMKTHEKRPGQGRNKQKRYIQTDRTFLLYIDLCHQQDHHLIIIIARCNLPSWLPRAIW